MKAFLKIGLNSIASALHGFGKTEGHSPHDGTARLVHAWKIQLLPSLQASAARAGARNQQARRPVGVDQRRDWRFTNPNLEELGLVRVEYLSVDELAADDAAFADAPPELRLAPPEKRKQAVAELLTYMRQGLAITADSLDPASVETTGMTQPDPFFLAEVETSLRS